MPTSTVIDSYPPGMLDVIEAVIQTQKSATMTYTTPGKAKSERLQFYGLLRALRLNTHSLADRIGPLKFYVRDNTLSICYNTSETVSDQYTAVADALLSEPGDAQNPIPSASLAQIGSEHGE